MPMTPEQRDELAALRRVVVRLIADLRNVNTGRFAELLTRWNEWNREPETKLDPVSLELLNWASAELRKLNNHLVEIGKRS